MPWWNDLEDEDELADRWQKERTKLDGFIRAYSRKPESEGRSRIEAR
jgi:hypothetical protein